MKKIELLDILTMTVSRETQTRKTEISVQIDKFFILFLISGVRVARYNVKGKLLVMK